MKDESVTECLADESVEGREVDVLLPVCVVVHDICLYRWYGSFVCVDDIERCASLRVSEDSCICAMHMFTVCMYVCVCVYINM